ncbi:uncharacterized protein [Danio rerio]|uniref:Uncharacterized protein n=1 Tax=Danio rerio TaxID=7955 RepID=A0A8M9PI24_DANRE|nr:uncharacterized protein LOC100535857 [Danio rerio]|eukprot:XP_021331037.1 uncharacterized protein LOC100535857 [Danio rerio]
MARQLNSSEIDAFEAINQFLLPRSNADAQREEDIIEVIDLTAEDEQEATDLVQATLVSSTRPEKRRLDYNFSPVSNKRLKIYTAVQDQHIEYDGDDEDEARLVPRSPDTSPLGPRESVFEIQQLPTSPASSPNGPSDCSIEAQHSPSPQRWSDDGESSDGYASTLGGGRSPVYTPYPSLVVEEEDDPEKEEENNHGGDHVFQPQQADDLTLTGPISIVEPDFNQLVLQYLERNQVKIDQISEYVLHQQRDIDEQLRGANQKLTEVLNLLNKAERDRRVLGSILCSIKNALIRR